MFLNSDINKKKMQRYNLSFNLLILIIVLIFFGLFFKVYNDYKDSQINDFIEYGIEQTAIVAKEIENKLLITLNEIHEDLDSLSHDDLKQKYQQIANAHFEIKDIFKADSMEELMSFQPLKQESFKTVLNQMIIPENSEKKLIISETVFDEGNIYLIILSRGSQTGCVLSVIDFRNLVQNIMLPISFKKYRGAYILDEKANILYHYQPEMIGKNVFTDFKSESLKKVHNRMLAEKTGHGFYLLDWILEEDVFYNKITAWNTLYIGNKSFKIARTSDLEEMNKELTSLRNSGMFLIILIFATLSVLSLLNLKFQTRLLRITSQTLKNELDKKAAEIEESEEKFKNYIENGQDLVIHIDEKFTIEYISASVKTILGYSPQEMIDKHLIHFVDRKNAIKISSLNELKEHIYSEGLISPMIRKDSTIIFIEWSISSGNYKNGEVYQLIGRDVTEKRLAEKKLKKTSEFRRELLEFSARVLDGSLEEIPYQEILERTLKYIEGDKKGSILVKCKDDRYRIIASKGYDTEVLKGISFSEEELYDSNTTQPVIKRKIERTHKLDPDTFSLLKTAGFDDPFTVMSVPIFMNNHLVARFAVDSFNKNEDFTDEDIEIASLFAQQIEVYLERQMHEKKLIEEKDKLYELAMFDSLTRLPNRLSMEKHFEKTCLGHKKRNKYTALLYINIKKFKDLNAIFGRFVGDDILKAIAQRLEGSINNQEFAARFESDEFILLIPYIEKDLFIKRVKEIREILKKAYQVNQTSITLNFKTGISLFPDDGDDFNTLFKNAGIAANQKDIPDDEVSFFKKTQVKKITERMFMEQRLRNSIDNPTNFHMYYQPCVNLGKTDNTDLELPHINHLEALIRWTSEDGRQIPPSAFIPIAEETGMIHKLGTIIAQQIAKQIVVFNQNEINVPVSMNLSAKELMRKDIVQMLGDILMENSLSGDKMGIEITESALIEDMTNSVQKLEAFKSLGMSISIDDFGTGYSSLSYINSFPIDYIKIDKSFVDKIAKEENSRSIVRTIISLTESLGAKTVAEGVETKEQLDILKDLGCNIIQGYFFYKPMPSSAILEL